MAITITLADDHTMVREGLRIILEHHADLRVIGEASDGYTAIRQVADLRPKVVVMDIAMPGLNGIEVSGQIMKKYPTTRIVILSVYATSEHVFRAVTAGALGYVVKECVGQQLVNAVRSVGNGCRYFSPRIADIAASLFVSRETTLSAKGPLDSLSPREREVLQLVVEGWSSAEIALRVYLSRKTVETYRSRLMQKLRIHDLPGLIKFALQHHLTPG